MPRLKVGRLITPVRPQPVADAVDADAVPVELMAEQRRDPRRRLGRLQRQDPPPVMVEGEGDIAPRHRQPLHRVEAGGIFGARRAQELAPRRHLVEQALDPDPGAGRKRGRPLPGRRAMVDLDPPAVARRASGFRASAARRWRSTAAPRRESRSWSPGRSRRRAASRSRAARAPGASRPAPCRSRRRSTSISSSPPAESRTATWLAPASSAFSTSSLSALAGRSTTSPAAMRLISSDGSLLIDMLRVLAQSEAAGEALIFRGNSVRIQWEVFNRLVKRRQRLSGFAH